MGRRKKTSPEHVAIIMDGNGRWAQARGKPRLFGHHAGARRVREIVEACPDFGVKYLTIFAFSTENWKRTQAEVSGLMKLFKRYLMSETKQLVEAGMGEAFGLKEEVLDSIAHDQAMGERHGDRGILG